MCDYHINAIGLSALLAISSNAFAAESPSYTIQISGYVPVICRVTSSARIIEISGPMVELVQIEEFCNNSQGYQVWLDHEPNSGATLYVDGKAIPLSEIGTTMISNSDRAALKTHSLSFDIGESEGRLSSVSLRIVPQ
jgi:type 1 fimbria pilin